MAALGSVVVCRVVENVAALVIALLLGILVGAAVSYLWMRVRMAQAEAGRQVAEARLGAAETALAQAGEKFQALADSALRSNQSAFLDAARATLETVRAQISGEMGQKQTALEGVVQPLAQTLRRLEEQVRDLERAREKAFGSLQQQLQGLERETTTLSKAMSAPKSRGRWGEMTLRRVAELAGMVENCDFVEQESRMAESGRIRPDMIVHLPEGRFIAVDAKVPLTAFLEAAAAVDEEGRRQALRRHSQQVTEHVRQLSAKSYWSQLQPAPEVVVLFLPGEHFMSAALEDNPSLLEDAMEQKVLVASPTTLIAVLKGIAFSWREHQLARNAEEIRTVTVELLDRLRVLQEHWEETGASLEKAVEAYNRAVSSWESRLAPSLRKVREMGAGGGEEAQEPARVEVAPKAFGSWNES